MSDPVAVAMDRLSGVEGEVIPGAPIAPWTSYRLGGPADLRVEIAQPAGLAALSHAAADSGLPVLIVGRGSNMLIADQGFRGIAVRLGEGFRWVDIDQEAGILRAGAGTPLPTVAARAAEAGLAGLSFAAAIPASVGGAVRMNAGAHGGEVGDVVSEVELWRLEHARSERVTGRDAGFSYRLSTLPDDSIVVWTSFRLAPGDPFDIREQMEQAKEQRRATQPLNLPNGGSVFKNPPGDHAARLIEEHVGKGTTIGGARISEVHANFIVAPSGASADDVLELIDLARRKVAEATGIELETEIKLIGFHGGC